MWIGSDVLGDKISKEKVNWQSRDQKEFTRAQKYVEKEVGFANYMSQADLAFDFYREKAHKFLYSSTINIGLFATASGRWELDNSDPDVKTKLVNLRGGFGATATYAFDWTWSYAVGPLPVFVGFTFGVSVGFGLEYDLTFCWVNGSFQKWQFRFIRDLTVNINLNLAAYAGIAPVTRQSGTSIHGEHPARGGNKRLKNALFQTAFVAIRLDPESRAYYDRKRAEGKRHNAAVMCLARRRCNVIYSMLRNGTLYQPGGTHTTTTTPPRTETTPAHAPRPRQDTTHPRIKRT